MAAYNFTFESSLIQNRKTMKTIALLLAMLLCSLIASAQDAEGITIQVTIENIQNNKGNVLAALHSEQTFMKGRGVQNIRIKATEGTTTLTFSNVPSGVYAISTLHDENDNYRMDFESNGMPKENYAMSGNNTFSGPPSFEEVQFEVTQEDLDIHLRF